MKKALILGAGLSGCTASRLLAESGYQVTLIESRYHVGGNIYDEYDEGVLVQRYGPHIWHTNNDEVNEFMLRFTEDIIPFSHKVLAITDEGILPYPVNTEVAKFIYGRSLEEELNDNFFYEHPANMREMMINKMGNRLYELYVESYTYRQWKKDPSELDASLASRVCVRDDTGGMFDSQKYCWMPTNGFTEVIMNMLDHPNIRTYLGVNVDMRYLEDMSSLVDLILISASPDDLLRTEEELPYIHVEFDFDKTSLELPDVRPDIAVYNYCKSDGPISRYTIYNNFVNNVKSDTSDIKIIGTETPLKDRSSNSTKCYPITVYDRDLHEYQHREYQQLIKDQLNCDTYFIGRLGLYRYLDMDKAIESTMEIVNKIIGDDN